MSSYLLDPDHYRELAVLLTVVFVRLPTVGVFWVLEGFFLCTSMVRNAYDKLLECGYVGMSQSLCFS